MNKVWGDLWNIQMASTWSWQQRDMLRYPVCFTQIEFTSQHGKKFFYLNWHRWLFCVSLQVWGSRPFSLHNRVPSFVMTIWYSVQKCRVGFSWLCKLNEKHTSSHGRRSGNICLKGIDPTRFVQRMTQFIWFESAWLPWKILTHSSACLPVPIYTPAEYLVRRAVLRSV